MFSCIRHKGNPGSFRLLIFVACAIVCCNLQAIAQVLIKDTIVISPRPAIGFGKGLFFPTTTDTFYSPCNPPPSTGNGIGDTTRVAVFYGDSSLSFRDLSCPSCPPHLMAGAITQGAQYVRVKLVGGPPDDYCGRIYEGGTSFFWREQCVSYDVVPVFDQQEPQPWVLVRFQLAYLAFPPPNVQWVEVYLVNPNYRVMAELLDDTVAYDSLSEIRLRVGAPCADPYPDTTVTFTASITSGSQWGSLVNPVTHDTSTTISGILPYSGTPHLYFIANGINPDSVAEVRLHFTASTSDVLPLDTGLVILGKRLEVTVDTTQIRPRRTGGVDTAAVTVRATLGGLPLSGMPVHLHARGVDSSGGHYHVVGRPAGVFGDSDGITDSNGVYRTTFYSNWFGGQEWIVASSSQTQQRDSVLMTLRVLGLELLPAGTHYVKIGGTCTHHGPDDDAPSACRTPDNNHYAAQLVRDSLPLMAIAWVDSSGQDTLFINDISLPYGGLFDHKATWNAPHTLHRRGLDVDVRTELLTANPPRRGVKVRSAQGQTVGNKEFVRLAKRFGVEWLEPHDPRTDNEHYHLYYRSP